MERDFSRMLYDKYFIFGNRNIEVKLKTGNVIKGRIIGFYKGDEYRNEPYIIRWHIVEANEKSMINDFDKTEGEIINQKDIVSVKFLEDNFLMNFEE